MVPPPYFERHQNADVRIRKGSIPYKTKNVNDELKKDAHTGVFFWLN